MASQGFQPCMVKTRCATMALTAPGFIEQRFLSDVTIDRAGFEENRIVRQELGGSDPYVMLSFLPEGMDFELAVTSRDHFEPERGQIGMRALAVVVGDAMGEAIAKLYFSYFPTEFPARVFHQEGEARAWLGAQQAAVKAG